jgi:hypothetical protein
MSEKSSFIYKTTDGSFFHISEVTEVSSEQFKDEDGTLAALKGVSPTYGLYIKLNGNSCAINLDEDFNKLSAGVPLNTPYAGTYEMSVHQKVERSFVETWGLLKYPNFGSYNEWKENAVKTRR